MSLCCLCVSNFCILVWPKEKQGEATTLLTIADLLGSVVSQVMVGEMLLESPWPCQSPWWGVQTWFVGSLWGRREALGVMEIRETFVWQWWGDCKGRRNQSRALKNTNTFKQGLKFEV